jgi:hypothetical protein
LGDSNCDHNISISGNAGDVVGVGIKGDGNITGKNITMGGSININKNNCLSDLDPQFKDSIKEFEKAIGEKLMGVPVPGDIKKSLQENIEKLATEVKGVKPDQVILDENKIDSIRSYLVTISDKIFDVSPSVAESIASVTPLAPFSKAIGKGVGFIAERLQKKLQRQ